MECDLVGLYVGWRMSWLVYECIGWNTSWLVYELVVGVQVGWSLRWLMYELVGLHVQTVQFRGMFEWIIE